MTDIHLDFETYSEVDLKKTGAWRYSEDPTTEVLMMSITSNSGGVELLTEKSLIVECLQDQLYSGADFCAWNSFFECSIIYNTLGLPNVVGDFSKWYDTMSYSQAAAMPASLAECAKAMFPKDKDAQKDKRGKLLISRLSKPQKIKGELVHPSQRWEDYDDLMAEFGEYCVQDTIVETKLHSVLRPLSANEREVWLRDQNINALGLSVDLELCSFGTKLYERHKKTQISAIETITGLSNGNSRAQLLPWLQDRMKIENLQSPTVRDALEGDDISDEVRKVLEMRSTSSRTPPKKFETIIARSCRDGKIRELMSYHGATTGRWASRGINVQNLPRPVLTDDFCAPGEHAFDYPIKLVKEENYDVIESQLGDTINILCSLIRPVLKADENSRFIISDYSSIEARVVAWLATEDNILGVFRTHGKVYEFTASQIYNTPLDKVTKQQRFVGKTASLALGYQGGYRAFLGMAANYGVELPEEMAKETVSKWRESNSNIVKFWYACQRRAIEAIKTPGRVKKVNNYVSFKVTTRKGYRFLQCRLPSGRLLSYFNPRIEQGDFGDQIVFYGVDSTTRKFAKQDTYGGKLVENITQAVARDILAEAIVRLKGSVYDIVLTVHDEIVCEVPNGEGSVDGLSDLMCIRPAWCEDLPLSAAGEETPRYWK